MRTVRSGSVRLSKRYWYHVSKPDHADDRRIVDRRPAGPLESVVRETILRRLLDRAWLTSVLATAGVRPEAISDALEQAPKDASALSGASGMDSLSAYLHRVELREGLVSFRVNLAPLLNDLVASEVLAPPIKVPITLQRNGRNRPIVLRADNVFRSAIRTSSRWSRMRGAGCRVSLKAGRVPLPNSPSGSSCVPAPSAASCRWPGSRRTSHRRSWKAASTLTLRPRPCVICRNSRSPGPTSAGPLGSLPPDPQHRPRRDITRNPPSETLCGNRSFWPLTETKCRRCSEPAPHKARKPRHNTACRNIWL